MRIVSVLLFIMVTAFAAPVFGQSLLGQWTATAVTQFGDVSETLTVVKTADGYEIKAVPVIPAPEGSPQAGPGSDIVIDGNKFSYKRTVNTPEGSLVITYTGTVSGDKFTGTVNIGGFAEAPYNGARIIQKK